MTKTARSSRASARVIPLRKGTTLEMVRLACPNSAQAQRISEGFGLAILDSDGIRDLHERLIIETADALKDGLSERAMQIHLQRIVGAYVGSAHGAASSTPAQSLKREMRPPSSPTTAAMRTSMVRSASIARPSAGVNSPPTWACRLTRFAWPPKAPSPPTKKSSARPGNLSSVPSTTRPTRSAGKRPRRRCRRSTDRQRGASAPRLFHCNQPKSRSARPALLRVAAATTSVAKITRHRCPSRSRSLRRTQCPHNGFAVLRVASALRVRGLWIRPWRTP